MHQWDQPKRSRLPPRRGRGVGRACGHRNTNQTHPPVKTGAQPGRKCSRTASQYPARRSTAVRKGESFRATRERGFFDYRGGKQNQKRCCDRPTQKYSLVVPSATGCNRSAQQEGASDERGPAAHLTLFLIDATVSLCLGESEIRRCSESLRVISSASSCRACRCGGASRLILALVLTFIGFPFFGCVPV